MYNTNPNIELIRLKKILEKTPEYKAVQRQKKICEEAQKKQNQLINESRNKEIALNLPRLKEIGYECRTGHSTDSSDYDYLICKSSLGKFVRVCSERYDVEVFVDGYDSFDGKDYFLGYGSSEDEAWADAVSNISRAY